MDMVKPVYLEKKPSELEPGQGLNRLRKPMKSLPADLLERSKVALLLISVKSELFSPVPWSMFDPFGTPLSSKTKNLNSKSLNSIRSATMLLFHVARWLKKNSAKSAKSCLKI